MRLVFLLLSLSGLAFAVPSQTLRSSRHVVHEKRAADPVNWAQTRRLESHKVLPMRFGLTQQNLHRIDEMLQAVSHPGSQTYGKHWTPTEVVDTFAPSDDTIAAVSEWLSAAGISADRLRLSASKGWIDVNATVAEVEELIKAEYHVYSHEESGAEQIGCASYSVPAHIQPHIDLIKPTVHFNHRPAPQLNKRADTSLGRPFENGRGPKQSSAKVTVSPSLETCDQMITLDCLRALYAIDYTPVSTHKNTFGIVEFTPQAYLATDLDMFFKNYTPSLVGVRPKTVLIDGAIIQTEWQSFDYNGESSLDLEYAMSLVNPQPITLLQTGDIVEGAGFDNWLDAVDGSYCTFEGGDDPTQDGIYPDTAPGGYDGPESCGIIAPPFVVSISYGQDESTVTAAFANRQCTEYAKLGLLGTSVLYSSGDDGVAGGGGVCLNAQHQPVTSGGTVFNPGFPVTCPYVTAVGATQVNPGATVEDPESACEQVIYSGGGFSNIFTIPWYQVDAVEEFLKDHPPPYKDGQYNNSGIARGFPDLAANGANYIIAVDGSFSLVYGTSASSPVVASMITLVNDARIAKGKGPVGFLNTAIYSTAFADAFNDITTGGNQGCGTAGFTATKGWDPVTGVGTPNLTKLLPLFLDLP